MKYEEFIVNVEKEIRKREGDEMKVHICRINRNNGVYTNSICLMAKGETVSPTIGLDVFYHMAGRGTPMAEIVDQILQHYSRCRNRGRIDISCFTDYSRARRRIVCRLIHYQKNKALLADIPYRRFLDLAVVYYYLLEEEGFQDAVIQVRNAHVELWGITPEELHAQSLKNMEQLLPYEFVTMSEMIEQLTGFPVSESKSESCPMYVLTNCQKSFGAACMICRAALKKIGEEIGEDYYLLPGSVHECILVPVSVSMTVEELQCMVQEINETQVETSEVLSNSVYRYDRSDESLRIALEGASI